MSAPELQTTENTLVRRLLLLFSGLALLAIAGTLMFRGQAIFAPESSTEGSPLGSIPAFSPTAVSGVGIAATGGSLPEAGDAAPDFSLQDLDGNLVKLSDLRGRPVILNFWATWCAPCRLEMPELQEAQAAYHEQDVVVLAVNQAESVEQIQRFLDELDIDLTAVLDSKGDVAQAYGAFFLPSTMFIDSDGNVSAFHRGIISRSQIDDYMLVTLPES